MDTPSHAEGNMAYLLKMLLGISLSLALCLPIKANDNTSAETLTTGNLPTITMAFYEDPSDNLYFRWGELIYTEAFARLGYQFRYQVVPPIRASMMADTGKVDGEPGRVFTYGDKVQHVIRVEEPIIETHLIAFSNNPNIKLADWQSLTTADYKVEYYRGILRVEQILTALIPETRLSESSSPINSFRKLLHGRIDIYIDSEISSQLLQQTPEFKDGLIKPIATLEAITSYGYLNERHSQLAINLAAQLKKMKQQGLFELYKQQAQASISSKQNK